MTDDTYDYSMMARKMNPPEADDDLFRPPHLDDELYIREEWDPSPLVISNKLTKPENPTVAYVCHTNFAHSDPALLRELRATDLNLRVIDPFDLVIAGETDRLEWCLRFALGGVSGVVIDPRGGYSEFRPHPHHIDSTAADVVDKVLGAAEWLEEIPVIITVETTVLRDYEQDYVMHSTADLARFFERVREYHAENRTPFARRPATPEEIERWDKRPKLLDSFDQVAGYVEAAFGIPASALTAEDLDYIRLGIDISRVSDPCRWIAHQRIETGVVDVRIIDRFSRGGLEGPNRVFWCLLPWSSPPWSQFRWAPIWLPETRQIAVVCAPVKSGEKQQEQLELPLETKEADGV
jgi:hypothetical protein